jgi:hypothetical protein
MVKRLILVVVVCGSLTGASVVALAQSGGSAESTQESTAPENSAADSDNVQYTAPGDADYGKATAAAARTHRVHARVQRAATVRKTVRVHRTARASQAAGTEQPGETSSEQESTVESEAGQPGEPANGHADAAGQGAQHECTGNCVE